jgi:hypothetical protein
MMRDDPKRLLCAARALAATCGDMWDDLDYAAKAHYQREAGSVVTALNAYDRAEHGRAVRAGHAQSRRDGSRSPPGRRLIDPSLAKQVAELLGKRFTTRTIRELTGLGNSTITRIRSEMAPAGAPEQ